MKVFYFQTSVELEPACFFVIHFQFRAMCLVRQLGQERYNVGLTFIPDYV